MEMFLNSRFRANSTLVDLTDGAGLMVSDDESSGVEEEQVSGLNSVGLRVLVNRGLVLGVLVCGFFVLRCNEVLAVEGVLSAGNQVLEQGLVSLGNALPRMSLLLIVFKEQGLILAALLGLSAFFSMAETSVTTLWPWKVRELAEKEPENGIFGMLNKDASRFLTTI
uniref:CNNM transmembrane domain-containing protein n=1 Tax=Kalanchoe fedtschenkoi TaxID=63787 RepID=A0A7N0RCF6_KALFE